MKNLIRFFLVGLVLGLTATAAEAATFTGRFVPFGDNAQSYAPGGQVILPALAANDSVIVYIPLARYWCPFGLGSSASVVKICYDADLNPVSGGTDSLAVVIGCGNRIGGAFNSTFSTALQSLVLTAATPFVCKVAAAETSLPPTVLMRFIVRAKGATAIAAGRQLNIRFPRVVPYGTATTR